MKLKLQFNKKIVTNITIFLQKNLYNLYGYDILGVNELGEVFL